MSDEEDPEVRADRERSEASERDLTRSGAIHWGRSRIRSKVPCRSRCGTLADWTQDAEELFETFNRILESRNEAPLDKTRVMFCDNCREALRRESINAAIRMREKVRDAIRELKAGCEPERERDLLIKLEKAGHPDIAGLRQWLADRASKRNSRPSKEVV